MKIKFAESGKMKQGQLSRTNFKGKLCYSTLAISILIEAFKEQNAKSFDVEFSRLTKNSIVTKFALNGRTMLLRNLRPTDTGFYEVYDRTLEVRQIAFKLYQLGVYNA